MNSRSYGVSRSRNVFQGRGAVVALIASGVAWGTSVPLSKVALGWLTPGALTVVRFGLAAAILLVVAHRRGTLGKARTLPVLASGAIGYGCSVAIQNVGLSRTSVTHASLIIGATPILVATGGKRVLGQALDKTVKAIEARNNQTTGENS